MKIVSVELSNFRQFEGQQKVVFSTDDEKNVTLIHAENGVGKTAFLNAILWCLYERTTENFEKPKELLNHHSRDAGEKSFFVYVEFEKDGELFMAQRSVNTISGKVFRVYRIEGASGYKEIDAPAVFINSIIPRDMAEYFFFQGEGIGRLTGSGGSEVKDAIRNILGFSVAEAALNDLKKLRTETRKDMQRLDTSEELGGVEGKIAEAEEIQAKESERLQNCDSERKATAKRLQQIEDELRNSNSDVVAEKQRLRDVKIRDLKNWKDQRQDALRGKATLVSRYAVCAFAQKLIDEGIDFIDEKELKGTIPAPYNAQLVKDILEKHACICGAEILPGTPAYGEIQKLLGKASDPVLLNRVRRARSQLTVLKRDTLNAEADINSANSSLARIDEQIRVTQNELDTISLELRDIDFDDIATKEEARKQAFLRLEQQNRTYGAIEGRLREAEQTIESLKSRENRLKATGPEVRKLQERLEFIERMIDRLASVLDETETSSMTMLATKINDFLGRYVKQDYSAKISEDFEIVLIDSSDRQVAKSDGQSLLLSLTFISSLIDIAKARDKASGEILTPGAVAPFVIDAPFGVLDNTYKANIAGQIPESVSQVVFLLSSSHWEGTVEEAIRSRVGAEYNMVLDVASPKGQKESSSIKILGKSYDTVNYDAPVERTRLEEVARYV